MARHLNTFTADLEEKSKIIRRKLLSKQHTLEIREALDVARAQEVADNEASRIESRQQSNEPINDEVNKLTKSRQSKDETKARKMNCCSCGEVFPHEEGRPRCTALKKRCLSFLKNIIILPNSAEAVIAHSK